MNRATLIGNLTKDVELKTIPSGKSVASFSVATNKVWKDQSGEKKQMTQFHNLVAWGKIAETLSKYLKKGSKIFVEGEIQTRDYTGQDGVKRYMTEIVVNNFEFLSPVVAKPAAPVDNISQHAPKNDYSQPDPNLEEIKPENIPF